MMQLDTWKAIGVYSGKIWSAVGPLAGVLVGAWLTRSWDHRKWLNDNRKEECRELLTAMTKVADSCLEVRSQMQSGRVATIEAIQEGWAEDRKCMIILQDRIFIAKRLSDVKMFRRWRETTTEFLKDGDSKKFGERLNEIKAIIIEIAMNG